MSFSTSTPTIKSKSTPAKRRNHAERSDISLKLQKKLVIHRIFEDATEFTEDPYWKGLLSAAARGDFSQKSIWFDGNHLHKIKRSGEDKELIPPLDPEAACDIFINFHQKHVNLLSSTDLDSARRDRNNLQDEDVPMEWKNCGKKLRHSLLCAFVEKLAENNQLSDETRLELQTDLLLLSSSGLLTLKNVAIEDNEIVEISILTIYPNKDSYSFSKDLDIDWEKKKAIPKVKKKQKGREHGSIAATYNMSTSPPKEITKKSR